MEQWKAIPGFEGLYEASTLGRIRSTEGKTSVSTRQVILHWRQKILKQNYRPDHKGRVDARITLRKNGRRKGFLVARLIARTWCPGYREGLTVNHIDGNTLNNRADNLEWITIRENIRKGFEDGQYSTTKAAVLVDRVGNEQTFYSMAEASRFLGKNSGFLSMRMKRRQSLEVGGYKVYPF